LPGFVKAALGVESSARGIPFLQDGRAMDSETGKAELRPRELGQSIKVAETVLRRRDRNLKAAAERAAQIVKVRRQQREYKKGKLRIVRAERLVKRARQRQGDRRRLKNAGKKPLPKKRKGRVLAAVRNGRDGSSKEAKITLRGLGLIEKHSLVFLPNTKDTREQLRTVKPFAFWGPPTFKVVCDLVHKRVHFRVPEKPTEKVALSDNVLIETHLGDLGLLCTEDIVHTIYTCSESFAKVTERLWPVALGDSKKAKGLVHDKHYTFGDLGGSINDKLVQLIGD